MHKKCLTNTRILCNMRFVLSTKEQYLIASESLVDVRTIERIYEGKTSKKITRERVTAAAKKLNLPAPPEPESKETP